MSALGTAAAVLVLLGVLILVHELGHFVFAKLFDVKVLRFSLGFGPRIVGFTYGETEYRLSALPLGGYVRLLGEDPGEPIPPIDRPRALAAKPLWQRYTVVVAGPVFNLLLPLLHLLRSLRRASATMLPPTIGTVLPDLPAATAGLLPGDRVESVDGQPRPLLGRAGAHDLDVGRQDAALRDPARARRRGARRHARSRSSARDRCSRKERVGWIGVSPRFHLPEIGVLDPSSPAAQAGLKTFDFITAVNGVPVATWTEFARAVERAGASPLRLNYVRGGYSAVPFAHIEIEEPGSAVVIPVAVFDAAGRRHYETGHPVGGAVRLLGRAGQPGRSDRPAPRRSDPVASTARRWRTGTCCASSSPAIPTRTSASAGSRPAGAHHEATLPAGGPLASSTSTARRSSGWCSARSTGWPGRPRRRCRSPTASATRSATRSSTPAQIIATMVVRLRRDRPRARPADDAGRPDHDRLRGRRRRRAGPRPVPVVDGGHQRQPRAAQLPAGADPRRRPAGVLHAGAVQATAAVAARAGDRDQGRPGDRRRS